MYDDAAHVAPANVQPREESLQLKAWQTKTDRVRKETKAVVAFASLSVLDWVNANYDLWNDMTTTAYLVVIFSCS